MLTSLALCCIAPLRADPAPVIHYAPDENLEHIDIASMHDLEKKTTGRPTAPRTRVKESAT